MKPSISLHENPHVGSSELANLSAQMRGWRHVLRDFGGCFDGSGTYWQPGEKGQDPFTTEEQAWQMFYNGLGRRIKVNLDDWGIYDGEIVKLTMTKDGITRVRDLNLVANSVKGIYSRFGSNAIINPGAEIGTTAGGTPAITTWTGGNSYRHVYGSSDYPECPFPDVQFKTDWKSKGAKSFWCDSSPCTYDGFDYGGGLLFTPTTAVLAGTFYALRFTINVTALTAGHQIRWVVVDGTQELGSGLVTAAGPGVMIFNTTFTTPTSVSGNFQLAIYSYYDISAVFYVDDVRLCIGGAQVETEIYRNGNSSSQYGTHHVDFVFGGMDDDEADRRIQLKLAEYAWPRTEFPEDISGGAGQDGLIVETMGYIDQARWMPVEMGGVDTVSDHIASLISQCELLSAGLVATNAQNVYVEELDSERIYDALLKLVQSGGASNVRYSAGVWQNLKFDYYASDTTPRYVRKGGVWCHVGGPPVEPCLMRPGLARDDDMLDEPYQGRNPRWMYLEEIEYDRDSDTVRCRRALDERNRLGTKPTAHDAATAATIIGMRGTVDMALIAPSQSHNILSATYHGDAATGTVVRGDLLYGNATPKIARLALGGAAGSFVRRDANDVMWSTLVLPNAATQGDLLYASGANTIGNLADVAVGRVLVSGGVGAAPAYSASPTLTGLILSGLTASTLIYSNATKVITSLANAAGYLTNNGTGTLSWSATTAPTAHNLLSTSHGDTAAAAVVDGDIIIGNVTPTWSRLAISVPAAGTLNYLGVNNGELRPSWKSASSNPGAAASILQSNTSGYLQLVRLVINAGASGVDTEQIRFNRTEDTLRYNSIYSLSAAGGAAAISICVHDGVTASSQVIALVCYGNGNVVIPGELGIGIIPSALLHVLGTTEQLRLGYDVSNYVAVTVSSAGAVTLNAVGATPTFTFSDLTIFSGGVWALSGTWFGALTDGATGGFYAGVLADCVLYRVASDTWYTPDSFQIAGNFLHGAGAVAYHTGDNVFSCGNFGANGDAEKIEILVRRSVAHTNNTTWYELFIDGSSARVTIHADSVWHWYALVVGTTVDVGIVASYRVEGIIKRVGNTTTMVSDSSVAAFYEGDAAWNIRATADDVNDSLKIEVLGNTGQTIRWLCHLRIWQVTYT